MPPHGVILSCPQKETPVGSTLRFRSAITHTPPMHCSNTEYVSPKKKPLRISPAIREAKPCPSTETVGADGDTGGGREGRDGVQERNASSSTDGC